MTDPFFVWGAAEFGADLYVNYLCDLLADGAAEESGAISAGNSLAFCSGFIAVSFP
jgi:hypothetical protein